MGKKHLHVTHMHDNDYINDDHYMPGIGKIDWYAIGKALNDIGYENVFSYEANRTFRLLGPYKDELSIDFLKLYVALGIHPRGIPFELGCCRHRPHCLRYRIYPY